MFVRMIIGEAIDDEHLKELIHSARDDDEIARNPGYRGMQILQEEGGKMVLIVTNWASRDDCFRYQGSQSYRQFLAKAQHALIGDFVVKLFKTE
jgi:heme-degrading monooxygenase HmoA